jgi:hypothetical protein
VESFVLWPLKVWPARGLNNFISVASILRLCEAVKVQFSDPYKNFVNCKFYSMCGIKKDAMIAVGMINGLLG